LSLEGGSIISNNLQLHKGNYLQFPFFISSSFSSIVISILKSGVFLIEIHKTYF